MLLRSAFIVASLGSVIPFVATGTVHARAPEPVVVAVPSDFDLSDHTADRGARPRYRLGADDGQAQFKKDKLGPRWSISPVSGGPTLELAALGAGRKGAPRLAHVGVDWTF